MAWLSDAVALHKGKRSTRVAPQTSIARFAFFGGSVATIDADNRFCPRRIEAARSDGGGDNSSSSFPLPKRHPGRETGSQSNGSLRDSRATEEALSADEPISFLSSGGGVCRGF
jgi:hypothetical protein